MDTTAVLRAYDQQLRRSTAAPAPGWTVEQTDRVLRMTAPPGATWGDGIVWSDLDESTADPEIAAAVDYFSGLRRRFEWKHHGYDRPADLPDRLLAARFVPEPQETLIVGLVDDVVEQAGDGSAPRGVTVRHLAGDEDWPRIRDLHAAVWDEDATGLVRELSAEHAADPAAMSVHVAEADGQVVCAAWARFHGGTDFASLWGGSTLAAYRRRGIYRALVARRAIEARERGFRYLQVDASDDSRPILERLGLHALTTTTPYIWAPPGNPATT